MNELVLLERIEAASGKGAKEALLKEAAKLPQAHELIDAALNYKRKFFIKKFDIETGGEMIATHHEFVVVLKHLQSGAAIGSSGRDLVEKFLSRCTPLQQKWYSRVLRKDLRAGFGVETANKCGFDIPEFDVQLAVDGNKIKKLDTLLKQGCYASEKYDGYRCIAVVEDGEVQLLTRSGQTYENFPSIAKSLSEMFPTGCYVFDGEIMSDDFNAMQRSAFASTRGTTVGDVAYHIFDLIPYEEWQADAFVTRYSERLGSLADLFAIHELHKTLKPNIRYVSHVKVETLDEIKQLELKYIGEGYEGVMVKPDIPYYRGRKTNAMMKFKTMKSMDCKVLSVYEGSNKNEGRLGGLKVCQENGVACDVGSGFTDADRDAIWRDPSTVIGRVAEIKYQELTPGDQRMRFPIFMRWRTDKDRK